MRRLTLILLITALSGLLFGAAPVKLDDAWRALSDGRDRDALRAIGNDRSTRAAQLAYAATVMSQQPAIDQNMREAEAIFIELAKGDDAIADEAAYLRARLWQLHYFTPDLAKAAELYTELAARHPQSHWAQLGLVKLGLLKLYALPDPASPDRLAPAEALLARIHEPALQRDLHLQIGQAGVVLRQPLRRLIPHLVAADQIGGIGATAYEDLVIQIGELSLRAGLLEQAKVYFTRYLKEYPAALRTFAVRKRLEEAERQLALAAKEGGK
ncbi:MAG: tetratricopeptide repeat protein [Verrucomicrobia bacterium]|nr:tetratricopeptide repeat protein [Verrucomicrobiota bacterium]